MPSYMLKSFRGGIAPHEDRGQEGAFKMAQNADIRKVADSLSCNQALTNEGVGVITDLILWSVSVGTQNSGAVPAYTYLFGDSGKIYKRDAAGTVTLVYTDAGGKILGAIEFTDASATYLLWATATSLHCKVISDGSNWSSIDTGLATFPKTISSASWHTMANVNGDIYICNGNKLAMLGYDDSFSTNVLQLVPGDYGKCLIERDSLAVIGTFAAGNRRSVFSYFWDTISDSYNLRKPMSADSINAIIDTGLQLAQVGSDGLVYYFDGVNKLPIFSFPGGGKCNPQGVEDDDGLALFGVFGATTGYNGVYSYGRRYLDHPIVLNLEYQLECDEIGMLSKVGDTLLISYKTGSTYGMKVVDGTVKATTTYESLDLPMPHTYTEMDKEPVWGSVLVNCKPLPAGCKIECWFQMNKDGTWVKASLPDETSIFQTTGEHQALFMVGANGGIANYKLQLTPYGNTSPEVNWIQPFFE